MRFLIAEHAWMDVLLSICSYTNCSAHQVVFLDYMFESIKLSQFSLICIANGLTVCTAYDTLYPLTPQFG